MSAVHICPPFSIRSVIIQVQHRCNGVYPNAIDVIFFQPVASTGNKEGANLSLSIVKDTGSPGFMLHFQRISIFITIRSVELAKSCGIFWKMCRHPVQNYTNSCLVEQVHHFLKIVRRSMPGGRCIVTRYLIAPGSIIRIFCQWHEFHMGIGHFFQIRNDFFCKSEITGECLPFFFLPGTQMNFINIHRAFINRMQFFLFLPRIIFPGIIAFI